MNDLNQEKRREELRQRYIKEAKFSLWIVIIAIVISAILAIGLFRLIDSRLDEWSVRTCERFDDCEEVKDYFESNGKEVLYRNYEQMSRDN